MRRLSFHSIKEEKTLSFYFLNERDFVNLSEVEKKITPFRKTLFLSLRNDQIVSYHSKRSPIFFLKNERNLYSNDFRKAITWFFFLKKEILIKLNSHLT